MNQCTRLLLLALHVTAGGCAGGSGGNGMAAPEPPPPSSPRPPTPPPASIGGLWTGEIVQEIDGRPETRRSGTMRGLITQQGEFRWMLDDADEQLFGTLNVSGDTFREGGGLMWYEFAYWATGNEDHWGYIDEIRGTIDKGVSLTGDFRTSWPDGTHTGSFHLVYDTLYERPSSLQTLAGTYATATDSLTIDAGGVLFYQSFASGCTGNGAARTIDTRYNLYGVTIFIHNCTGGEAARNGHAFEGLAYLDDSESGVVNDVLRFVTRAFDYETGERQYVWSHAARR